LTELEVLRSKDDKLIKNIFDAVLGCKRRRAKHGIAEEGVGRLEATLEISYLNKSNTYPVDCDNDRGTMRLPRKFIIPFFCMPWGQQGFGTVRYGTLRKKFDRCNKCPKLYNEKYGHGKRNPVWTCIKFFDSRKKKPFKLR